MTQTISIVSTKGGPGKTTTTANLGAYLADEGKRVLLIDFDPSANLSTYYEVVDAKSGIVEVFKSKSLDGCISTTVIENMDIVYNNDPRGELVQFIEKSPIGYTLLPYAIGQLEGQYDYVLIDTQGAYSSMFDVAVYCADLVFAPVNADSLAGTEFISNTVPKINELRADAHMNNQTVGKVLAMVCKKARTNIQNKHRDDLEANQDDGYILIDSVVPRLTIYEEAVAAGMPVHRMNGDKAREAAALLEKIWSEISAHLEVANNE